MKEGNQTTDSAQNIRKRRKRGWTNFTGPWPKRQRELKKRDGLKDGGFESPRKVSKSAVNKKGQSWRLEC